ncbi:MAG: succinate dehydrogenase, hydrophobic membrane anchor protein [Moraxella sp.]|nr:MAG: succinate dehydrogenase, hydrophobic membrane anchor protein [Moraxella sp.]
MGDVLMSKNSFSVKSASGLTGSGSRDWFLQRLSAVVLAVYSLVMIGFFLTSDVTYQTWHAFMSATGMKVFTLVALAALVFHAWVGMWTVFTDYVKATGLRIFLQIATVTAIFVYLFWGMMIFWG